MQAFKPAAVILLVSLGALLVAGAARKQEDGLGDGRLELEEHGHFDDDHQGEHRPHHHQQHHQHNLNLGGVHHQQEGGLLGGGGLNKGAELVVDSMASGLSGMINGGGDNNKVAPLAVINEAPKAIVEQVVEVPRAVAPAVGLGHNKHQEAGGPMPLIPPMPAFLEAPIKAANDLTRLFLDPVELTKYISAHFRLPLTRLVERIGSQLVVGFEAMLQPLLACIRIVERVFQPDTCRLRLICRMGANLHFAQQHLFKFSPNFLDGSAHLKAFHEGYSGRECETVYPDCDGLKLKRPFEELKSIEKPAKLGLESGPLNKV